MLISSRHIMYCILFLSWWIVSVSGETDFKHETFLDSEENVQLLWRVEDDTIVFEVRAKTTGYVGIGLSSNGGMKGADIMIGWVQDGTPYISDRHGVGNEEPLIDIQDDYQLLYGSETDGLTIIGYQRKLLTCDMDDYDITSDTVRVIWAYHYTDPEGLSATYHGSKRRGVKSLLFMDLLSQNLKSLPDDVLILDVLNDNITVPSVTDTTYWCTYVELPTLSSPHQVIRIEPVIQVGNEGIVHHMVLRECHGLQSIKGSKSSDCGSDAMDGFKSCGKVILGWAVGGGTQEFPEHVGYRLSDVKYIQLIVHYDNQKLIKGINDSSGLRLYYTPTLRQYDASILLTGLETRHLFLIPPKEEAFTAFGSCDTKCSKEVFANGDIKIFSLVLHAHLAAIGIRLTHYRNGKYIGEIARDKTYDFNLQETRYLQNHWTVKPGDDLLVECTYNTMDREKPTFNGLASMDEMCVVFLMYYPKANADRCMSNPNPKNLETLLNLSDTGDRSLRQALENLEWTPERKYAARRWYGTSRLSKCTNYSAKSVFPEFKNLPGYSSIVETKDLGEILELQTQVVEKDLCSHGLTLKAAHLTVFALLITVTLTIYSSV